MAVTTRSKAAPASGHEELAAEVAQLRADNQLLALGLAKALVMLAPGIAPASFTQITTQIHRIYTNEQAARVEQMITGG